MTDFPIIIPSFLLLQLTVVDGGGTSEDIRIGLKYLTREQKRRLGRKLLGITLDSPVYRGILKSVVVFVDSIRLSNGELTDSIQSDIIYSVLNSPPYFRAISDTFLKYLYSKLAPPSLVSNLRELGEWQALQDYGDSSAELEKAIEEDFGDIIVFDDEEEVKVDEKPKEYTFVFTENLKVFQIFRHLRRWQGEYGQLDMTLLSILCKEYKVETKDIIDNLSVLHFTYLTKKQELTPKRD